MDEWDKISQEIWNERLALERLEDDFQRDKREVEQLIQFNDEVFSRFRAQTEQRYEEISWESQQAGHSIGEAFPETQSLLNHIALDSENHYRLQNRLLYDDLEDLETTYRKHYREQEDKIETLRSKLRLLDK